MAETPQHILVVCTANVCRSPMAEGLLRHALNAEPEPLKSIPVISAGIGAFDGDPPSENSVRVMQKVGIDIRHHESQHVREETMHNALLVICMTEAHRHALRLRYPDVQVPILLVREEMPPGADPEVPDPFGYNLDYYEATRDSIVEAIPALINYIKVLKGVG